MTRYTLVENSGKGFYLSQNEAFSSHLASPKKSLILLREPYISETPKVFVQMILVKEISLSVNTK
jgi:hypothetical protein